jgi:hypothetical protein
MDLAGNPYLVLNIAAIGIHRRVRTHQHLWPNFRGGRRIETMSLPRGPNNRPAMSPEFNMGAKTKVVFGIGKPRIFITRTTTVRICSLSEPLEIRQNVLENLANTTLLSRRYGLRMSETCAGI